MDDFEERLRQGLDRQAGNLGSYDDKLDIVTRRGRNRRWATRGAGAFGGLVLLAGGIIGYNALQDDPVEEVRTAVDDAEDLENAEDTVDESPTPDAELAVAEDPAVRVLDDLVVGAGWGVGVVEAGEYYSTVPCCADDPWGWPDAEAINEDGILIEPGAVRAFDDFEGGIVYASRSALLWLRSERLPSADPVLIDSIALFGTTDDSHELKLWDVGTIEGTTFAVYSKTTFEAGGGGRAELLARSFEGDLLLLEEYSWTGVDDPNWINYRGAALAGDTVLVLRDAAQGTCQWIDFLGTDGTGLGAAAAYPAPAEDPRACPNGGIEGATLSPDGTRIVAVESGPANATVVIRDVATDAVELTVDLPPASGQWSELDFDGVRLAVSTGFALPPADWGTADQTVLIDTVEQTATAASLSGAPALRSTAIDLGALTLLDMSDRRWFSATGRNLSTLDVGARPAAPAQATTPEPAPTPEPTPTPDPTATPEPTPTATLPFPESDLVAVGRLNRIVPSGTFAGADSCFGTTPDSQVCLGMGFEETSAILSSIHGSEMSDDPSTFLEGEPNGPDTFIWIGDNDVRVTIEAPDGFVGEIRVSPETPTGKVTPFEADPAFLDVIAVLGAPNQIFQGGGEGWDQVTLSYDTEAAFVHYSFHVSWGEDASPLIPGIGGFLESLPVEYLDLPIVGFRAEAAG